MKSDLKYNIEHRLQTECFILAKEHNLILQWDWDEQFKELCIYIIDMNKFRNNAYKSSYIELNQYAGDVVDLISNRITKMKEEMDDLKCQ